MTDLELTEALLKLSESDCLSDDESKVAFLAARVIDRKRRAKEEMREAHSDVTQALGRLFTKVGQL